MVGTIHPKTTMFLRNNVGTGRTGGCIYEMTTHIPNGTPMVKSEQTGKYFTLSWQDIINLAIEAGIDKEE